MPHLGGPVPSREQLPSDKAVLRQIYLSASGLLHFRVLCAHTRVGVYSAVWSTQGNLQGNHLPA